MVRAEEAEIEKEPAVQAVALHVAPSTANKQGFTVELGKSLKILTRFINKIWCLFIILKAFYCSFLGNVI